MKTIQVLAARTQEDVLNHQCDVVETCDTIKEAKAQAKYVISDDFKAAAEMSEPLGYSQVVVDGQCLYDYFRR